MKKLKSMFEVIPDFPELGIIFRDITSVLKTQRRPAAGHRFMDDLLKGTPDFVW